MRIVHVHATYWPVIGGLERVVEKLSNRMVKLGHEVCVVTSTYGSKGRPKEEVINGVCIHRVKSLKLYYKATIYPIEFPTKIFREADVVHAHHQSLFVTKMIEKAHRQGTKIIIHIMSVDALDDYPNPIVRIFGSLFYRSLLKRTLKASDLKLVKSYRDMEILKNKYGVEAQYIPDGVDEEFLEIPPMPGSFRERLGLQDPFVIYIGRLHKLKGIHVLIKAMSIVIKEYPRLKAVIVGSGNQKPYRELAKKLGVEKNIVFTGYLDEETKISALDASLALVLPSICNYAEAFSIVTSEAWARGKPVIASAVGEMPYRIKHLVNGLVVPPRDPKALAEAIILIANDEKLAHILGNEGRKNVVTWSEIVKKLIDIYKKAES